MADEENAFAPRMHPKDLAALAEAMRAGVAAPPLPPGVPPADATGADAALWKRFEDMLDAKLDKHGDAMIAQCRSQLDELFADLEMPVRTLEQRIETRKKLGKLFELQEAAASWKKEFFGNLIKASAGWVAALFMAGFAMWLAKSGGGGGHS